MGKIVTHKLLSIDLDGTLLSPIFRIAKKRDCLAIQEYMQSGGIAFINSGRPLGSSKVHMDKINKLGPAKMSFISCLNGAYIKDFSDNEIIAKQLTHECAKQIFEIVKSVDARHAYCWFYFPSDMEKNHIQTAPFPWWHNFFPFSKLVRLESQNDLSCCKITIISFNANTIEKIYERLYQCGLDKLVKIVHTTKTIIEVTPLGVDKGYSLKYFSEKYKIPKEQICSIGDTPNDIAAFENSGLSIALKPKNKTLHEKVTHVIPHKICGVSKAIKTYLLTEGK